LEHEISREPFDTRCASCVLCGAGRVEQDAGNGEYSSSLRGSEATEAIYLLIGLLRHCALDCREFLAMTVVGDRCLILDARCAVCLVCARTVR
jgi:hypothetical protein